MPARLFPPTFLWGAATAAHQTEGNNVGSDWWAREVAPGSPLAEPSGDADDGFHRYPQDIALLAGSGLTTYRFSIEWARIEPAEGMISRAALAHYARMIDCCHAHGVTPLVTLHHFSSPLWFEASGGWRDPRSTERFVRYVEAVLPILRPHVQHVITINEPNILAMLATFAKGDEQLAADALPAPDAEVSDALTAAHRAVTGLIRAAGLQVGWSVAPQQLWADPGAEDVLREYAYPRETRFLEAAREDDFVAVQAYSRTRITLDGPVQPPEGTELTLTGWEYYPPAIAEAVQLAWDLTGRPVLVSENGIATADDARRIDYTRDALLALHAVIEAGVPVLGYLHWSLLDNYEWGSYAPTFGLVAVDRSTFERTPRPSLAYLGGVARANGL
ncbi:MAG TPA: family 1 glycosylhydrolase [Cellulomonas sp.]